jgi:hypothetical protein
MSEPGFRPVPVYELAKRALTSPNRKPQIWHTKSGCIAA